MTARSLAQIVREAIEASKAVDVESMALAALSAMSEEQILRIATTRVKQMVRRYYNEELEGGDPLSPDQLVVLKGEDRVLGELGQPDRNWIADQRELLASGLSRSADRIRQGFGPSRASAAPVTIDEVLRAERRSRSLAALISVIEDKLDDPSSQLAARTQAAQARIDAATTRLAELREDAATIVHGWEKGSKLKRLKQWSSTRKVVRQMKEFLDG